MIVIQDPLVEIGKGAEHWNSFAKTIHDREFTENANDPEVKIEKAIFFDLDLEGLGFSFIHFDKCTFKNCTFTKCDWNCTSFNKCTFDVCLFIGGDGEAFSIDDSDVQESKFEGLRFGEGGLSNSRFKDTDFDGCEWDGDSFAHSVLTRCIFIKSVFDECDIEACRFHFSNLWQCTFRSCSFDDLSMVGTDFMGILGNSSIGFPEWHDVSDLYEGSERKPDGCRFFSCQFSGCELGGLNFGESDLADTSFYRCDLTSADLSACSRVSTGAFPSSDVAATRLPNTVNFDPQIRDLKESNSSLQRISYFSLAVSFSAIVSTFSNLTGSDRIKFPPLGFELAPTEFSGVVLVLVIALQLTMMVRAENIAWATATLPVMLPDHCALPSKIRDSFVSDICWRFLYTPTIHPRLADRAYGFLPVVIAFLVLYFQFPIAVAAIVTFAVFHSLHALPIAIFVLCAGSSLSLAMWGAFSLIFALRGRHLSQYLLNRRG